MTKIDRTIAQDFGVSYMDRALNDVNGIIADVRAAMKGIKYDTIVVTGASGMMIGPILARALRKNVFVVRKEAEFQSSHSYSKFLGKLGKRWIFVDDFCSSGETFKRVRDGVREAVADINRPRSWWDEEAQRSRYEDTRDLVEFETELVGYFEYQKPGAAGYYTPWDENAEPGYSEFYRSDTPAVIAEKARQEEEAAKRDRERAERLVRDANRKAERELGAATVTIPSVGEYTAALVQARREQVCGVNGCDICEANARQAVEMKLGTPTTTDENGNRIPVSLEELMNS